jgi:hypothetical protein
VAALLASALAGLLVAATLGGRYAVAAAVAGVQALLVLGLVRADVAPATRVGGVVALLAGIAGALVVAVRDPGLAPSSLQPLAAVVGLGLVAMAVVQLARRDGRASLTASLSASVTMLALGAMAAVWVGLAVYPAGPAAMLVALTAVAVAVFFAVFPGPRWLWVVAGTAGAIGAGLLVQSYAPQASEAGLGVVPAALLAAGASLAAWTGLGVARWVVQDGAAAGEPAYDVSALTSALLVATLPLALAAPVVFAAGLLVVD